MSDRRYPGAEVGDAGRMADEALGEIAKAQIVAPCATADENERLIKSELRRQGLERQ